MFLNFLNFKTHLWVELVLCLICRDQLFLGLLLTENVFFRPAMILSILDVTVHSLCFVFRMYDSVSHRSHVSSVECALCTFRCPVCRYCQTPEPVEENKCFECGVQEVCQYNKDIIALLSSSWIHLFFPWLFVAEPVDLFDMWAHRLWSLCESACLQALWGNPTYLCYAAHKSPCVGLCRR